MFKSIIKIAKNIHHQVCGSVTDYVSTRPTEEQKFWYEGNCGGLWKSAKENKQVYALIRFFVIHIGGIWLLRFGFFIVAIWALLLVGFSTIGRF